MLLETQQIHWVPLRKAVHFLDCAGLNRIGNLFLSKLQMSALQVMQALSQALRSSHEQYVNVWHKGCSCVPIKLYLPTQAEHNLVTHEVEVSVSQGLPSQFFWMKIEPVHIDLPSLQCINPYGSSLSNISQWVQSKHVYWQQYWK